MPITTEEKKIIIEKFGRGEKDSGTPEVQIAILTHRIRELTDHLRKHKKDNHTRRGLVNLVSKRKKMLKYLIKRDADAYVKLMKELGIRG